MVIGPDEIEAETPIIALDLNVRDDCCHHNSDNCCHHNSDDCCSNNNNDCCNNNVANLANVVNLNNVANLANVIMGIENRNCCCNNNNHHSDCNCNTSNLAGLQTNTQKLIRDFGINVLTNC